MAAFADMLAATSTGQAPRYLVPANRKWYRNLVVAERVVAALDAMHLKTPPAPAGGQLRDLKNHIARSLCPQDGMRQKSTLGKPKFIAAWPMYLTKGAYNEQWISSPHDLSGECRNGNPLFRGGSTSTRRSAQKL
jgi:hypothetical protein